MYCLCSDRAFDTILDLQRKHPLPLDDMISSYTKCNAGCGTCIEALKAEADMLGLVPENHDIQAA